MRLHGIISLLKTEERILKSVKNSIYQKLHRFAMKFMHFIHAPWDRPDQSQRKNEIASVDSDAKPITNQGKYSHLKYGASSIGKTGCIPIAIYNALLLSAKCTPGFQEIVEDVKSHKAPLLGGRMGTDPYMIDMILKEYGVDCLEITDRLSLEKEMDAADKGTLFLITQWNDRRRPLKGIHAYVVEKHSDDLWAAYNLVYREYPTKAKSLTEMLGRGRLIVADKIL